MSFRVLSSISNALGALFALIAAALWYKSAMVRVPLKPGSMGSADMVVDGSAFVATANTQTAWSRRAAFAAAVAATCQALGLAFETA